MKAEQPYSLATHLKFCWRGKKKAAASHGKLLNLSEIGDAKKNEVKYLK